MLIAEIIIASFSPADETETEEIRGWAPLTRYGWFALFPR